MKQITIRMFVALAMCGVTSVLRFASLIAAPRVGTQSVWVLRLVLASVLSPLFYSFLDRHTSNWAIRVRHKHRSGESVELNQLSHRSRSAV